MQFHHGLQQHSTPEQYFRKLKTPHEVINAAESPDSQQEVEVLQEILNRGYNDKEAENKEGVLQELKTIVSQWLASRVSELPWRCGLEIFGSYQLGASSHDSDIDAVCIVPPNVTREKDFFGELVTLLGRHPRVQEVFPIPSAIVPLIKIRLKGVQFDILMSQVNTNMLQLPRETFFGSDVLDVLPERELKSINGCRVAYYLRNNIQHYDYFKLALKALKMWAKNKGVYSQIFCYIGGIGYTIMLAKVCQLYPNYGPLKLLERFFFLYSRWVWDVPICLENIPISEDKLGERPEMSVMTPVSPSMNAVHSVSKSTLRIMRRQFIEASRVIERIHNQNKPWSDLFASSRFFERHKSFLELSVMARTARDFTNWKGHIESKFRKLIKLLQTVENGCLVEVTPNPREFTAVHNGYAHCSKYYFGVSCRRYNLDDDSKELDFSPAIRSFLQQVEVYSEIERCPQQINVGVACISRTEVPQDILANESCYAYK